MKRVLFLFPNDWDLEELQQRNPPPGVEIVFEGFDRQRFSERVRLLAFDPARFIERIVARYQGKIDGVASNDDHFGALLAALIAQRLSLPGNDPQTIVRCQHKVWMREATIDVFPGETPDFWDLRRPLKPAAIEAIDYPVWVKPVKSSFSILARLVESPKALLRAAQFTWYEQIAQRVLLRPVEKLFQLASPSGSRSPGFLSALIPERPLKGQQINVDGYVDHDGVHIIGVADSIMYPGTHAFQRFQVPSRLGPDEINQVIDSAKALIQSLGYRHGFFNLEAMVRTNPESKTIDIGWIEVNARMARQLASLYQSSLGINLWQILINLALGESTAALRSPRPRIRVAASFVSRSFNGRPTAPEPTAGQQSAVMKQFPEARMYFYFRPHGMGFHREMKWVGSYRYAVINLSADHLGQLERDYETVLNLLGWRQAKELSHSLSHSQSA
jgi:biotin carboxylase